MARTVLLVEPDVDLLGVLASKLRSRGLEVWIADGVDSALSRSRDRLPDVLLVARSVEADLVGAFELLPGLSRVPLVRLLPRDVSLIPEALYADDADAIASRVHSFPAGPPSSAPEISDFRGDLSQVSLLDLTQLLGLNRRSGILMLQTPLGAGEVRFCEGELADAMYRRLEGKKALFRLMGEREGTFSFVGGAPTPLLRRIEASTQALLMDGLRETDETRALRAELDLEDDALIAFAPEGSEVAEVESMVLSMLVTPRTLSELLDEVPALDLEVLRAVDALLKTGAVRRIAGGTRRTELADPDRMGVLAGLCKRIARPGFRGAGRVAFAAMPRQLLGVMAALGRIADAMMPSEAVPTTPIPHVLSTLRLGDGVELEVVGIPLVEAYAPLWAVVLPGCTALALLDGEPRETLEAACQLYSIPVLHGQDLVGDAEDVDPESVALLVQRLLESASGG